MLIHPEVPTVNRFLFLLACLCAVSTAKAEPVTYHYATVDGLKVFYREAGPADAPVVLLLHGFPTSSRMFDGLMPLLADRYHLIAPDYPGFGHSDAPPPEAFAYTFDHIAAVMDHFTQALGLRRYSVYMFDYGSPVGFRLAIAHPDRIQSLIVQDANGSEEGLSPGWKLRRAYWADRSGYEEQVRQASLSYDATWQRHLSTSSHPERMDPDTWQDEYAFLSRPGEERIQLDLIYDYRTNVAAYPNWDAYLLKYRPPLLVVWGRYDPAFTVAGALAYARGQPEAEIHLLDAGHFALDEAAPEIAALMRHFLGNLPEDPAR
jgi:pimeloyl-ACP methyl ester carboxylesterase